MGFSYAIRMSTAKRVLAILHLCLVFTMICWSGGFPFMGELYHLKSKKMLYESVLNDRERFAKLPESKRFEIEAGYHQLEEESKTPFLTKLARSWKILAFYLSPFCQAWILFSIIIPILLLLKIEGSELAAWILPLLVAFYVWDNHANGVDANPETKLFPTEEYLVSRYLDAPLSSNILTQKEELIHAWNGYLKQEWAQKEDLAEGWFRFNIARIKAQAQQRYAWQFRQRESSSILLLYLGWNLFFAAVISLTRLEGLQEVKT